MKNKLNVLKVDTSTEPFQDTSKITENATVEYMKSPSTTSRLKNEGFGRTFIKNLLDAVSKMTMDQHKEHLFKNVIGKIGDINQSNTKNDLFQIIDQVDKSDQAIYQNLLERIQEEKNYSVEQSEDYLNLEFKMTLKSFLSKVDVDSKKNTMDKINLQGAFIGVQSGLQAKHKTKTTNLEYHPVHSKITSQILKLVLILEMDKTIFRVSKARVKTLLHRELSYKIPSVLLDNPEFIENMEYDLETIAKKEAKTLFEEIRKRFIGTGKIIKREELLIQFNKFNRYSERYDEITRQSSKKLNDLIQEKIEENYKALEYNPVNNIQHKYHVIQFIIELTSFYVHMFTYKHMKRLKLRYMQNFYDLFGKEFWFKTKDLPHDVLGLQDNLDYLIRFVQKEDAVYFKKQLSNTMKQIVCLDNYSDQQVNKELTKHKDQMLKMISVTKKTRLEDVSFESNQKFKSNTNPFKVIILSDDGKYLFAGLTNGDINVYDLAIKDQKSDSNYQLSEKNDYMRPYFVFKGHKSEITSMILTPHQDFLITSSKYGSQKIFDVSEVDSCSSLKDFSCFDDDVDKDLVKNENSHEKTKDYICSMHVFSKTDLQNHHHSRSQFTAKCNQTLVTGSKKGVIKSYDITKLNNFKTGDFEQYKLEQKKIKAATNKINCLTTDINAKFLFAASQDRSVKLYEIKQNSSIKKSSVFNLVEILEEIVASMVIDKMGTYLYCGGEKGSVQIFSLQRIEYGDVECIFKYDKIHSEKIFSMFIDISSRYLFTCSKDNSLKAFNIEESDNLSNEPLLHYDKMFDGKIISACIDSTSDLIFTFGGKKNSYALNKYNMKDLRGLDFGVSRIWKNISDCEIEVIRTDRASNFMFVGAGKELKVFNIQDMKNIQDDEIYNFPILEHSDYKTISINADNTLLFTNGDKNSVNVYNIENLPIEARIVFCFKNIHESQITKIKLGRENKYMFTCSADKSLKIFNIESIPNFKENCRVPVKIYADCHDQSINHISIDKDNNYLFTVSEDRSMKVFDIRDKKNLPSKPIIHYKRVQSTAITSTHIGKENSYQFTSGEGRDINVYSIKEILENYLNKSKSIQKSESKFSKGNAVTVKKEVDNVLCSMINNDKKNFVLNEKDKNSLLSQENQEGDVITETNTKPMFIFKNVKTPGMSDICITKDNRFLIECNENKTQKFFDLQSINNLRTDPFQVLNMDFSFCKIALCSEGKYLFLGTKEGHVKVFTIKSVLCQFRSSKMIYNKYYTRFDEFDSDNAKMNIMLFNTKKMMNASTYSLISDYLLNLENDEHTKDLKKILVEERANILANYSKVKIITIFDIMILTFVFRNQHLENNICEFIDVVMNNKNIPKPGVLEIFEWLLLLFNRRIDNPVPLNESVGKSLMMSLVQNQMFELPYFTKATKDTIDQGLVNCPSRQLLCEGENLSQKELEEFKIVDYDSSQMEVKVYAFSSPIMLEYPSPIQMQYLYCYEDYIEDEYSLLSERVTYQFIDQIWKNYKSLHMKLLIQSLFPLLLLYVNGFQLSMEKTNWLAVKIVCTLQTVFSSLQQFYEFHQFARNPMKYLYTTTNLIDLTAIFFFISSAQYLQTNQTSDAMTTSLYSIALLLGFIKLYKNLEVQDEFRHLSYALFKIISDQKIYMFLAFQFITSFSMIFFVTKFNDNKEIKGHEKQYYLYTLSSYEYVFGNWESVNPDDLDARWLIILHVQFSFVFGVIFVNVLIAIVSDSFAAVQTDKRSISTFLKIELIRDAMDLKIRFAELFGISKHHCKKLNYHLYIIFDSHIAEERPDTKIILDKVDWMHTTMTEQQKNEAIMAVDFEIVKKNTTKVKKSVKVLQQHVQTTQLDIEKIKKMIKNHLNIQSDNSDEEGRDEVLQLNPSFSQINFSEKHDSRSGEKMKRKKKANFITEKGIDTQGVYIKPPIRKQESQNIDNKEIKALKTGSDREINKKK